MIKLKNFLRLSQVNMYVATNFNKLKNIKNIPWIIEGYDISKIF
jgi:hypothetical protein